MLVCACLSPCSFLCLLARVLLELVLEECVLCVFMFKVE